MSSITGYNPATVATLTSGTYRHVALSISGTWHTLYFDGVQVAQNLNGGNVFASYTSTIPNIFIGCAADLSYPFTGAIDDFKIWNRVLVPADINAIYSSQVKFSPISINGLSLWLDAATTSSLTLSTNQVTQWNDLAGNTNLSNPGSNYPTYSATGLNGKPTINFAGNSTSFQTLYNSSPPALYSSLSSFSYFAVLKSVPSTANWATCFSIYRNFVIYFGSAQNINPSNPWFHNGSALSSGSGDARAYIDNTIIIFRVTVSGGSASINIYGGNGTYTNTLSVTAGTASSQIIYVGASGYGPADSFNGIISEMLFYNTALTALQYQQIEGYLAWKWGLQTNLPTTHPYYNSPSSPLYYTNKTISSSPYTIVNGYIFITLLSSNTVTVTTSTTMYYLVVGGGGGGSYFYGGGGGGGGVSNGNVNIPSVDTLTITVGNGGKSNIGQANPIVVESNTGYPGENSTIAFNNNPLLKIDVSGGSASIATTSQNGQAGGRSGYPQNNAGGTPGSGSIYGGGGGGGAGGSGSNNPQNNKGGNGGIGYAITSNVFNNILASPTYFGGGGAGSPNATGGLGGGGNSGSSGRPNTGGGSGGDCPSNIGKGGSGVVYLAFPV